MIHVLLVLVVVGFILYMVNAYVPMDDKIKKVIGFVVLLMLLVWLLSVFGLYKMPNLNL